MNIFKSKFFILSFICAALFVIFVSAAVTYYIVSGIPPVYELEEYSPSLTTKVFDRNNNLIYEFSVEKRQLVPLDEIPVDIQNAVIAMEDRNFFKHAGFSLKGILRALINDLLIGKAAQGGSTVTQQLSRGVFLTKEKKIIRKIREIFLSVQIEHAFSKQEILQMYLNEIYLGEGAYGVKAAAKKYFNKDLSELTLGESAMMVGVIPLPSRYNPFAHPEMAKQRRALVLNSMLEMGFITEDEAKAAKEEPLPEKKQADEKPGLYFIEYVRRILEPKYGMDTFWKGGLNIYTTIDIEKQALAEQIMNERLHEYDLKIAKNLGIEIIDEDIPSEENLENEDEQTSEEKPEQEEYPQLQGAFFARDVKTGAIRVMVGGRNYEESRFNRATQAKRQPGSAFKPFVWMAALEKGYTPSSMVKDLEMVFYYDGSNWRVFDEAKDQYSLQLAAQPFMYSKDFDVWAPRNFGGGSSGFSTLRRALELSKNLVAVNLIDAVGVRNTINVARRAGVKSALPNAPALALGVSVMSLDELVSALSTFANNGIYVEEYAIERVEDQNGRVLEQHIPNEREAFSPQDSFILINMMKGVVQRGTGGVARALKKPLAGKTGTSQSHRDTWFIGMTPNIAAGAWMGYDDDTSQESGRWTGGGAVAPWWTAIMQEVLKDEPADDFPVPDGISFAFINPDTGKLALPGDKNKFLEAFKKGTEPSSF
ncbi:penicillin-binding protein 1A [Candidatus Proelusimicrobium volucris]|uniref:penicillin-binding protein 1A n=1 Tax=Candidatus Proelusimicrobium volucris TaxID=3416225 RepID=UPI003D0A2B5C